MGLQRVGQRPNSKTDWWNQGIFLSVFPPTSPSPPPRLVIISPLVVRRGQCPINVFKRRLWNSITLPCEIWGLLRGVSVTGDKALTLEAFWVSSSRSRQNLDYGGGGNVYFKLSNNELVVFPKDERTGPLNESRPRRGSLLRTKRAVDLSPYPPPPRSGSGAGKTAGALSLPGSTPLVRALAVQTDAWDLLHPTGWNVNS